jgi:hypothetical protein
VINGKTIPIVSYSVGASRPFAQAIHRPRESAATAATMSFKLDNVVVESSQQSGGGGAPAESLSLACTR